MYAVWNERDRAARAPRGPSVPPAPRVRFAAPSNGEYIDTDLPAHVYANVPPGEYGTATAEQQPLLR